MVALLSSGWAVSEGAADEKSEARQREKVAREIRDFVEAPARFVWVETRRAYYYIRPQTLGYLSGIDTEDGRGERRLLKKPGGYAKPVFTPDGSGVVYTDVAKGRVFAVDWIGGEPRDLGKGFASDVWRDPETGVDWVYLRRGAGTEKDPVVRRQLGNPKIEQMIWDQTDNGQDHTPWFQLSRDGKRFSDAFPWNRCGIGNLETNRWKWYYGGCWPGISFDETYRVFVFSGSHKSIRMFQAGGEESRSVSLSTVPGLKGKKVYFPRWSNHPRFMTISAPKGGTKTNIFLGRFDKKWESIEEWVKVSHGPQAEIFGDAWIEPAERKPSIFSRFLSVFRSEPEAGTSMEDAAADGWPVSSEKLLWVWENAKAKNEAPALEGEDRPFMAQGNLRGRARLGRYFELLLDGGYFEAGEDAGVRLVSSARASKSFSLEAVVNPDREEVSGTIVAFARSAGGCNLVLAQQGNGRLILRGDDGSGIDLARLEAGKPTHLIVSYDSGRTTCFLDGKPVFDEKADGLKPENWEPGPLFLGGEGVAGTDWEGSLQRVAIYGRAIGPEEAAGLAASSIARLESFPPATRWTVEATLVEATRIPAVEELDSYRRALVENVYEIDRVVEGQIPGGVEKRIVVLQWVIMDRKPLPSNDELKPGAERRLTLEPREAHPALESEFRSSDHGEFVLPVFLDVNSHR